MSEAKPLADAYLTSLRGEPCAVLEWSAVEARTHWRFTWNTVEATEGRAPALKGVDPVAVDKRSGLAVLDPRKTDPSAPVNAVFPSPAQGPLETKTEAASIAQGWLDATMEQWSSLASARELFCGWAFSWNTDAYLHEGDLLRAYTGNGPLIVLRSTGELYMLGSALPFDQACAEFEREALRRR